MWHVNAHPGMTQSSGKQCRMFMICITDNPCLVELSASIFYSFEARIKDVTYSLKFRQILCCDCDRLIGDICVS